MASVTSSHSANPPEIRRVGPPAFQRSLILAGVLLLSRLPYLTHPTPVHPDEAEFLAALGFPERYPVHPPGYPLWVALGSALHGLGVGPYVSYAAWSLLASIAAPVLLYGLLRRHVDDTLAALTAASLGACPLTWFLSVTTLTYLAASALALAVFWLCTNAAMDRSARIACLAAALLAPSLSLRPDLLLWLGPAFLYACLRAGWRSAWSAVAVVAAGAIASSLWSRWLYDDDTGKAAMAHTRDVLLNTSVFRLGLYDGLLRSAVKLAGFLAWSLGPALIAFLAVPRIRRAMAPDRCEKELYRMLWLWAGPMMLFFLTVHQSEAGHMLLLPPLYALLALLLHTRLPPAAGRRVALLIAVLSAAQFTVYPWSEKSSGIKRLLDAKIAFVSGRGLMRIDRRAEIHRMGDTWRTRAHDQEKGSGE